MTCDCEDCPNCQRVTIESSKMETLVKLVRAVQDDAYGASGGGGMPGAIHVYKAKARAALIRLNAAVAVLLREVEEG